MKILFVHGINVMQDASTVGDLWRTILSASPNPPSALETSLVYYADVFEELEESQGYLGAGELALIEDWASAVLPEPPQGFGEEAVDQLARFLARRVQQLPEPLVRSLVRRGAIQAYAYMHRPAIRSVVLARFNDSLTALQPDVVFAHSLGSVIAYEGLSSPNMPLRRPARLVTAGSPLATRKAILDHLHPPAANGLPTPIAVREWINVRHLADPVSAAGGLSELFSAVTEDVVIEVPLRQCHQAESYLRSEIVREILLAEDT